MSLPAWPDGLPYMPLADGFGIPEPHVAPIETEFDGGAYRRRPRATVRRALFSTARLFDSSQYQAFREFYHTTLGEGSLRFTMQVPDGNGGAYATRTVQFKGMYKVAQPNPPNWHVSAELYVFRSI